MRKSRVIALVVASLVSSASYAQAQSATPNARAERREMRGMRGMRGMHGKRGGGPMRGITLSDAEKARLKEIHGKFAAESKSLRTSLKPDKQAARAARQKGDTAAARAAWDRSKSGREQLKALHDRQQAELRSALSPDNQKLFDANLAQRAQRRAEWEKKGGRKEKRAERKEESKEERKENH